jgi:hypothetical protein
LYVTGFLANPMGTLPGGWVLDLDTHPRVGTPIGWV